MNKIRLNQYVYGTHYRIKKIDERQYFYAVRNCIDVLTFQFSGRKEIVWSLVDE